MIVCAREECQVGFTAKTHNQKYCGSECCRIETNRRIMDKYYAKRDRKLGKTRYCNDCKNTKLSKYNETNTCGGCSLKERQASKKGLLNFVLTLSA